jgi:hypothetical protein
VVVGLLLWREGVVARLLAKFLPGNPPVLYGAHEVVSSPTEVLTDRRPVVGDRREFHKSAPFTFDGIEK